MATNPKTSKCVVTLEAIQEANRASDDISEALYGLDTETLTKIIESIGDPVKANQFMQKSLWAKAEGVMYEFSVNFMVSGLSTSKVNIMGNAVTQGMQLVKQTGALASAAVTSGPASIRARTESLVLVDQLEGTVQTFKDLFQLGRPVEGKRGWAKLTDLPLDLFSHPDFVVGTASGRRKQLEELARLRGGSKAAPDSAGAQRRAQASEDNALDNPTRERAVTADYLGFDPKSKTGQTVDAIGAGVNVFGEILRHEDLVAKTFQYRLEMAKLVRHRAEQMGGTRADMETNAAFFKATPTDDMVVEAANLANRNTFTDELGRFGQLGRSLLQYKGLRLFTPFYRTLVNLQKMGIRESAAGEIGRAISGLRGGHEYYKKLAARTPEGDAARSQFLFSGLMTYGVVSMFDDDPLEKGYGFTGNLDMKDPLQRLYANDIAPEWSYKWPDGDIWEFGDIEPIRGMMAFYMSGKELLARDGVEVYNPETGELINTQENVWELLNVPISNMYGDYFAMESFGKLTNLMEALASPNSPGAKARATAAFQDILASMVTPKIVKDINAAGSILEDQFLKPEPQNKVFDNELRRGVTMMEKLDNAWFGSDQGVPYTVWGDRKKAMRGLTQTAQSSLFTKFRKPDAIDFAFQKSGVTFLDNPKKLNMAGTGVTLKVSTQQTEEFMKLNGNGGYIDETGVELNTFREFVSNIMFDPRVRLKPEHIQRKILQAQINKRSAAVSALVISRSEDLTEKVRAQLTRKAQLDAGTLSPTVPFDRAYLMNLFNFSVDQELLAL